MALGLVARKLGMTRIFTEAGASQPATVLEVTPNRVAQMRADEVDGYRAVQVTTGVRKPSRVSKAMAGHYGKAGVQPGRGLWEFRVAEGEAAGLAAGGEYGADLFEVGARVDVTGTSKGKGFAGAIKRHNFRSQDATHGNSVSHRAPGSTGQNQTPGRVFKGKKMAGHLGNVRTTTQNLEVIKVDAERNLLVIKGAVPGATGGDVLVKPSVKAKG